MVYKCGIYTELKTCDCLYCYFPCKHFVGVPCLINTALNPHPFQTIQYSAHGKVAAKEVRELASLSHGKTRAGESDVWRHELLYVPPLPPTNLRGCHLISVQYDVFVSTVDPLWTPHHLGTPSSCVTSQNPKSKVLKPCCTSPTPSFFFDGVVHFFFWVGTKF